MTQKGTNIMAVAVEDDIPNDVMVNSAPLTVFGYETHSLRTEPTGGVNGTNYSGPSRRNKMEYRRSLSGNRKIRI